MERSTMLSRTVNPPISMGHLYHGYVSHNQRVVNLWFFRSLILTHSHIINGVWDSQKSPRRQETSPHGLSKSSAKSSCGCHKDLEILATHRKWIPITVTYESTKFNLYCIWLYMIWLVVQPTPLKNDGVSNSWDDDIPNWMESHKIRGSKAPTRYLINHY